MSAGWNAPLQWISDSGLEVAGQYGKTRVRTSRILRRSGTRHDFQEMEVECLLEGDIEHSYFKADNSIIVPTDTVKNTVHIVTLQSKAETTEELSIEIAKHLLVKHAHLKRVTIGIDEVGWERIVIDGEEHDHAFRHTPVVATVRAVVQRDKQAPERLYTAELVSGIKNLRVLKTTMSGFENYIVDNYTSLKPTLDRIFSTLVTARWKQSISGEAHADYKAMRERVMDCIIKKFAGPCKGGVYSDSVQGTMWEMASTILTQEPGVEEVMLELPNLHYLLFPTDQFGVSNENKVLVPQSEPSGLIKLRVRRSDI